MTTPSSSRHRGAALDMTVGEAIYSLRAIRRHKPDPIPDEHITAMLDAAIQAPNGANLQLWHFLVVTDPELRERFAPLYKQAWWAKRHDEGYEGPENLPDHYHSPMRLADEIGESPLLIFVCATVRGSQAANAILPAVQNLILAGRSLGIGGTITTLHPTVEDQVHELFEIPETAQIVYCMPFGYPRGNFGPVSRRPLGEVSSRDTWGH